MTQEKQAGGPLLQDLDPTDQLDPSTADPISDLGHEVAEGVPRQAMPARPPRGRVMGFLTAAIGILVSLAVSLWAWDFLMASIDRSPALGAVVGGLIAVIVVLAMFVLLREMVALGRLRKIDDLRHAVDEALSLSDVPAARNSAERVMHLYRARPELAWQHADTTRALTDAVDADAVLAAVERGFLMPLDILARQEIESASRNVAAATALIPLALADVAVALLTSLSMIRRIAEIYGGRSGVVGSWRLYRVVFSHLVATGAIAIGDDLIGSVAGGGLLTKVSRRFGEGVINGALTARVGIAAMEVCRPMPFQVGSRPSVSGVVGRSVSGLFSKSSR